MNRQNFFNGFEQLSQLFATNNKLKAENIFISYKDVRSRSSCSFNITDLSNSLALY